MREFERGTGSREIYPSLDQINKVRSKKSKGFSGRNQVISKKKKVFTEIARDFPAEIGNSSGFYGRVQVISKKKKKVFTEIARDFPAEIGNSCGFSGQRRMFSKKKKRSSSQKRHKHWCQSTTNTNLDLDLRSRSSEPVNFFGAQSSLGGGTIFVWGGTSSQLGGHVPGMPPHGAGSVSTAKNISHGYIS